MTVELGCVLGIPLFAAILLALVGHWRAAGTINAVCSLLTLIAAAFLTRRIITDGSMWAYDMQFFVDPLWSVSLPPCSRAPTCASSTITAAFRQGDCGSITACSRCSCAPC